MFNHFKKIMNTGKSLSGFAGLVAVAALMISDAQAQSSSDRGSSDRGPSDQAILDSLTVKDKQAFRAQPEGALSGASIFLSAGHGWLYNSEKESWNTQRSVTNGIIEDHSNAEWVMQYVVPYLWNAGARVYTTRERDFQTNEVIIEAKPGAAGFSAIGDWNSEENLLGVLDGDMISIASTKSKPTAAAVFTPDIPEAGFYGVTIRYRPSTLGKSSNEAQFVINHTGGQTVWTQNINHDGYTWKYIGQYYFEAGANFDSGSVSLINRAKKSGRVTVDAVRFGGGMGSFLGTDGLPSGKPRWEESGMYHARFLGYDPDKTSKPYNSVRTMPIWAEWEMEEWEKDKAIWLSWHGNASGPAARGLFGFVYGTDEWSGVENFTGYPGSEILTQDLLDQIGDDVHATWDSEWRVGNLVSWWLGETNPKANAKMPMALIETGFFSNPEDAKYMLSPEFRMLTSRSTLQGLVEYYSDNVRGFNKDTMLPEPPTHFHVTSDEGVMSTGWNQPPSDNGDGVLGDKAKDYIVYESPNGYGFDNGSETGKTKFKPEQSAGSIVRYFKVAALNKGGESWPSEVLAYRNGTGDKKVLLVYGFDRLDSGLNHIEDDGEGAHRGILSKMNTRDYVVQHAEAIKVSNWGIESASDEAVTDGLVDLNHYDAVMVILGRENSLDKSFLTKISDYKTAGGNLMISGSEIVGSLSEDSEIKSWLWDTLGVDAANSDNSIYSVSTVDGEIFDGITGINLSNGSERGYRLPDTDVLKTHGDSRPLLTFGGTANIAGIVTGDDNPSVVLGFPFEAIDNPEARSRMMVRILYLLGGE